MTTPYQMVLRHSSAKVRRRSSGYTDWERRNPQIAEVYVLMNQAIRLGWLKRQPCEVCGGRAEAHHEDYEKPLAVRWLCHLHHRARHSAIREQLTGVKAFSLVTEAA